ncbi:hypothetical protein HYH03_001828 [Edaphochlamys debaryana]|uniref:Amino acid transporter transmembrane domain-containing protein n=1 Tax=Edaphochlamys debaryana TaxID=47281 RepID=A0A835YC77_9CHLO|nr:hypothetical protein HYH03_001828 [Edaphochlamys debaryana]|eukprot:KAG2500250.1 hypothetical protein HYH03_001828 [Edaphochlamys debaryana]
MANSIVGAGVLSLPFAFQATGLLGGLIMCTTVCVTEGLTGYVLSKFAERYQARTYVELVRRALGRKLAVFLSTILVVAMFGSCVAYLIIMADNLTALFGAFGLPPWACDRQVVVAAIGFLVELPMCLPRDLGALNTLNRVAVLGFLVGAALVVARSFQLAFERDDVWEGVELFSLNYHSLFAIPIVVFGFNCHSMIVSIFAELDPTPTIVVPALPPSPSYFRRFRYIPRPNSRKLLGMLSVIMASSVLVLTVYVAMGVSGYMAFPDHISANILVSFDQNDPIVNVARVAVTLIVLGSYALTHHPARGGFEHLAQPLLARAGGPVPRWASVAFTVVFVSASTAVAEVVSDLGVVLQLVGGLCITFIIFFLPGLLLINAAIVKHSTQVLNDLEAEAIASLRVSNSGEAPADAEAGGAGGLTEPLLVRTASLTGMKDSHLHRLVSARDKGIKKAGYMYAPRLSWLWGTLLLVLSLLVAGVTLVTVILGGEN